MSVNLVWADNFGCPVVNGAGGGSAIIEDNGEYVMLERCELSRYTSPMDVRRIHIGTVGKTAAKQWKDMGWRDVTV